MEKILNKIWCEKYRPHNIEDYVFHDAQQKLSIVKMISERSIPHLLFTGSAGTGKTTLAQILIKEMQVDDTDVLTINASDENSVDVMREKIKNFIGTFALGPFKIIHLEEADHISQAGQAILRRMMEEYTDSARFILTCNYDNKILPPIKSRCQHFRFKASSHDDIAEFVVKILINEKVKFDLDLVDKYILSSYPDIRKAINLLQQNTINGVLQPPQIENTGGDYKFQLIELIESDSWNEARALLCSNVSQEEWEDVFRFLYENLSKAPKFKDQSKWEEGIVIIADHLYKNSVVADQEINAAAMLIRLTQI